jgi:uncharacterized membrane protein
MTSAAQSSARRLAYIDWMRGLACVIMFQAHCYDSWLNADSRQSWLYLWSQRVSTLPAPIFLFLAGMALALTTESQRHKGATQGEIARKSIVRGAQIFGLGVLFRVQEYVLGFPKSPWTDLLRVDVLNIIGISIVLMALLCWLTGGKSRTRTIVGALCVAAAIAMLTPPLWTTHRPRFLPWPLESYINGVHIYNEPQVWLFPVFPWAAFAFAGLAAGFSLLSDWAKRKETLAIALTGGAGIAAMAISFWLDAWPRPFFAVYDYWHTSPNFFLLRCGVLLMFLFLIYAWCRWGPAQKGFSPMIQLGKTSLLVYWAHIEFVYGRLSILPKWRCGIPLATVGLAVILVAMVGLSVWRTRWKQRQRSALREPVESLEAAI